MRENWQNFYTLSYLEDMEQIALNLPEEMLQELNQLSQKRNIPRANIIRFAISRFIEEEREKERMQQLLEEKYGELNSRETLKRAIKETIKEMLKGGDEW